MKRSPKALREAKSIVAETGLPGAWREGGQGHQFVVNGRVALTISFGGDCKLNPTIVRQQLTRFQRDHVPRSQPHH